MKVWRYVVFSLMVSFVILGGGICCKALADEGLPDGFKILKEKMEKKEIPDADFAKFKFHIPETVPDEITNLRAISGVGRSHPATKLREQGLLHISFLLTLTSKQEKCRSFGLGRQRPRTKPGWTILTGKVDTER